MLTEAHWQDKRELDKIKFVSVNNAIFRTVYQQFLSLFHSTQQCPQNLNGLQENEISLVQVCSSEYHSFQKNKLLTLSRGRLEWKLNLFEIEYFFVQICTFSYFSMKRSQRRRFIATTCQVNEFFPLRCPISYLQNTENCLITHSSCQQ